MTDVALAHVGLVEPLGHEELCASCHGASTTALVLRYRAKGEPEHDAGAPFAAAGSSYGAPSSATQLLRLENVDELARDKDDLFFKPCHGFASRGVLTGKEVGHERLRRLVKKGVSYVAQRKAPKSRIESNAGVPLWTDLRVWAHRGERLLMSGRASLHPDSVDLSPPGGWLATFAEA